MNKSKKISVFSMLIIFGFIIFSNIGGCGGGNGNGVTNGSNAEEIVESPEFNCQSPPLNTDFSDRAVFFVDTEKSILIGITSDSEIVEIFLSDIPDSGARFALIAETLSETTCDVILGAADFDMDFDFNDEIIFQSSGLCRLQEEFSVIELENLEIAGFPFGFDIKGECDEIIFFDQITKDLKSANEVMFGKYTEFTSKDLENVEQIYLYQEKLGESVK